VNAIPISQVDAAYAQVRALIGEFQSVRAAGSHYAAIFTKGACEGQVSIDAQGRFTSLTIVPADAQATSGKPVSTAEALAAFRALPGRVSVLITRDDAELGAIDPAEARAAGSTFKLAILAALRADIEAKKRSWSDVVEVPATLHVPSGILEGWPDRAPVTLHTLASLMISISDNTATDALLSVVGRSAVEPIAGANIPFLSTRAAFHLKGNAQARAAYGKADAQQRRVLIEQLEKQALPAEESFPTTPTLDVEWFFSARELCTLMKRVQDLPVMHINPGIAKKADWDKVAYKGGSEHGVLSMTTWLRKGKSESCVTATVNAEHSVDDHAFVAAYGKAIASLKH
jgi:beta-lactamase class A